MPARTVAETAITASFRAFEPKTSPSELYFAICLSIWAARWRGNHLFTGHALEMGSYRRFPIGGLLRCTRLRSCAFGMYPHLEFLAGRHYQALNNSVTRRMCAGRLFGRCLCHRRLHLLGDRRTVFFAFR